MIKDLYATSGRLESTLERYLDTCLALAHLDEQDITFSSVTVPSILDELKRITSYEVAIDRSKKLLGKIRNRYKKAVPINSLPPEILACIFYLASTADLCTLSRICAPSYYDHRSKLPLLLSQVCSYWRSVSRGSHGLWTHIDLIPCVSERVYKKVINAGRLFTSYSGELPLDIDPNLEGSKHYCHRHLPRFPDLLELCVSSATRARSIKLDVMDLSTTERRFIVETLLANCVPGKLSRLIISVIPGIMEFLLAANGSQGPLIHNTWMLDIPHHHLEEILSRITILRLDGVYPYWTSQAYSGLVKLHLTVGSEYIISISRLAGILNASPQLRYAYLCIATLIQENTRPPPIRLDDLEVLHIATSDPEQHESMLRLILPGSKPLRMSTKSWRNRNETVSCLTKGEHRRFFERTNIVQLNALWVEGSDSSLDLPVLLGPLPNLEILTLSGLSIWRHDDTSTTWASDNAHSLSRPIELRVENLLTITDLLCWVAKVFSIAKLVLAWKTCKVWSDSDLNIISTPYACKDKLDEVVPIVEFVDSIGVAEDWNWNWSYAHGVCIMHQIH